MEKMALKDTVCSESLPSAGSGGVQCNKGLELVPICTVSFRIFFFSPLCSHTACSKMLVFGHVYTVNSFYHFVRKKGNGITVSNEKFQY